jgi:hypothetical protein
MEGSSGNSGMGKQPAIEIRIISREIEKLILMACKNVKKSFFSKY